MTVMLGGDTVKLLGVTFVFHARLSAVNVTVAVERLVCTVDGDTPITTGGSLPGSVISIR